MVWWSNPRFLSFFWCYHWNVNTFFSLFLTKNTASVTKSSLRSLRSFTWVSWGYFSPAQIWYIVQTTIPSICSLIWYILRSWPVLFTLTFFYILLFCWKIKSCCDRCFPQQISWCTFTWGQKWTQTGLRFHFGVKFHFGKVTSLSAFTWLRARLNSLQFKFHFGQFDHCSIIYITRLF